MRWLLPVTLGLLHTLGVRRVPAGTAATVHIRGRYRRTLNAGWHWLCPLREQLGRPVDLIGHHLDVRSDARHAELYFQVLDPDQTGAVLDDVDGLVTRTAHDALRTLESGQSENLQRELNRRVGGLGLRVVRCSLQLA